MSAESKVSMSGEDNQAGDQNRTAQKSSRRSRKSAGAFRTISEVADILDVQQHVLRFWETKFSQVRPLKRGGGRRYYRPEDVELLKTIHHLLYTEGFTIKGAQKLLREQGKNKIIEEVQSEEPALSSVTSAPAPAPSSPQQASTPADTQDAAVSPKTKEVLKVMLEELKALRAMVSAD